MRKTIKLFALVLLMACAGENNNTSTELNTDFLEEGKWLVQLDLNGDMLPFNMEYKADEGQFVIINAEERIIADEYRYEGDSLFLRMPLFDSEFIGKVSPDKKEWIGYWHNYCKGPDYRIPFKAEHGIPYRFCENNASIPPLHFATRYQVDFSPKDSLDHYQAIGMFETHPGVNRISGTFATETGDYRYLEGNFCDGQLKLSAFDGSHAFLFRADYKDKNLVNGLFKSGTHWIEPWQASPNDTFELRDPAVLTQVLDTHALWKTKFVDIKGNPQTISDVQGEVSIIQLMGTWCPNCVDETRSYIQLYERYQDRGLKIIPLCFERVDSLEKAQKVIAKFQNKLEAPYPFYFAGKANKSESAAVVPALNHVMSYPTSIIIDKSGTVHHVHTGFYGPGTGIYYDNWYHDTEMLLDKLLSHSEELALKE